MHSIRLASSMIAASLAIATPSLVFAHVGHGDEFQAEGGINRVQVNPETDPILGIQVTPIEPAADGSAAVLVPVTALVDADGKQLVFVQYENFYEPVPVTTGATQGELIEVTEGLSVGELLVTQGSLSLYAESRKTQTAEAETPSAETATTPQAEPTPAPAPMEAQGTLPTETAETAETIAVAETAPEASGLPIGKLAIGGGVVALVAGAIALFSSRKQKGTFSSKDGSL
jgi:membrane fusion protein, cation efflux system